jgi:uncharacterized protein (TIGR00661 family)
MSKIIVAPLCWGLGHATRCIPIIHSLVKSKYTPVIASDGAALKLLRKEFPILEYITLPSYNIQYAKNLKWSLLLQSPKILKAVKEEKQLIAEYIQKNDLVGIISDNRFGARSAEIPSVYITHQVNVLSGIFTFFTSKIHQQIINKFDECWIPDYIESPTFSGKLSHIEKNRINTKRIGILSRFSQEKKPIENDILIVLSGPEPHRQILEMKLLQEFKEYQGHVILVQGVLSDTQVTSRQGSITTYNYMLSQQLQDVINSSELVICRSGYSSIMDLAKLDKKAFFIPTPNQTEQEYLAHYLECQKIAPYAEQKLFKVEMLEKVKEYKGLKSNNKALESSLFDFFESKRKS